MSVQTAAGWKRGPARYVILGVSTGVAALIGGAMIDLIMSAQHLEPTVGESIRAAEDWEASYTVGVYAGRIVGGVLGYFLALGLCESLDPRRYVLVWALTLGGGLVGCYLGWHSSAPEDTPRAIEQHGVDALPFESTEPWKDTTRLDRARPVGVIVGTALGAFIGWLLAVALASQLGLRRRPDEEPSSVKKVTQRLQKLVQ